MMERSSQPGNSRRQRWSNRSAAPNQAELATNRDETSLSSTTSGRPVRRRRLAHRRQYAKTRRLATNNLRSQFVRYDAILAQQQRPPDSGPLTAYSSSSLDSCPGAGRAPRLVLEARSLSLFNSATARTGSGQQRQSQQQQQQQHQSAERPRELIQKPIADRRAGLINSGVGRLRWSSAQQVVGSCSELAVQQSSKVQRQQQWQPKSILAQLITFPLVDSSRPLGSSSSRQSRSLHQLAERKQETVKQHSISQPKLVYQLTKGSSLITKTVTSHSRSQLVTTNPKQCIDNVHFNDIFHGSVNDSSSLTINQSVRHDPRLYKDDVDIKFSRALNSCKLPQIRYASKERLFERLTDLRFLSIEFLNTFLLTYRVFTTAQDVLEALKSVHYNCDRYLQPAQLMQQPQQSSSSLVQPASPAQDSSEPSSEPLMSPSLNLSSKDAPASLRLQPRPAVPPRLLHIQPAAQHPDSKQRQPDENFLLAPNINSGQHKRRSTINALTPITGSNASSLVNLTSGGLLARADQTFSALQQEEERSGLSDGQMDHLLAGRSFGSQAGSLSSSFSTNEPVERLNQQELVIIQSDLSEQLQSKLPGRLERNRSCSMSQPKMSLTSSRPADCSSLEADKNSHRAYLSVPQGRQVRASSFSHIPSAIASAKPAGLAGNEHWRLSYRKSTLALAPDSVAKCNLLAVGVTAMSRRASSSDADALTTCQVTLCPPQSPLGLSRQSGSLVELSCLPPSWPKEEPHLLTQERPGDTSEDLPRVPPPSPMNQSAQTEAQTRGKSGQEKRLRRRRRRNYSTSGSSLAASASSSALSSNSASTNSVISSQSESGLIQTSSASSHPGSAEPVLGAHKSGSLPETTANRAPICLVLKEIELCEAKALDCDTSADEDRLLTSNSSESVSDQLNQSNKQIELLSRLSRRQQDSEKKNLERSSRKADGSSRKIGIIKERKSHHQSNRSLNKASKSENVQNEDLSKLSSDAGEFGDVQREQAKASVSDQIKSGSETISSLSRARVSLASSELRGATDSVCNRRAVSSVVAPATSGSTRSIGNCTSVAADSYATTPRSSFQFQALEAGGSPKAGVVVSSSSPRITSRRSSTASAASAFAAATAASNNPLLTQLPTFKRQLPRSPTSADRTSTGELFHRSLAEPHQHGKSPLSYSPAHSAATGTGSQCLCSMFAQSSMSHQRGSGPLTPRHQSSPNTAADQSGHQNDGNFHASHHHPSCIYSNQSPVSMSEQRQQQLVQHVPNSEISSLCNSRASSRLSSNAGLEFSAYSSSMGQPNAIYSSQQLQCPMNNQANSTASGLIGSKLSITGNPSSQWCSNRSGQFSSMSSKVQSASLQTSQSRPKRNSAQINVRSVATIRVLSVLRHWVSKHSQDFVNDTKLANLVQEFLQDLIVDSNLLPAEHKAAQQLQQMVQKASHARGALIDLDLLLAAPAQPSSDSIETLSALEIAEGMTYLDHKIFLAIRSEEFLGQAWMKIDKAVKAPHILLITKRFNDVSRLVSSEIIRVSELSRRVSIIEKWTNVAHICRVVHNFNGVLQICAAFTNSAVFRLKKTWDKIPRTTKSTIDQLQKLVSTDSRFRNMRDAINRCDPPSIPYVGMYLTDLSFIEEGTPNYSPDGLLNFSKMRMISHVIREIQHLQNGSYKIELNQRVANYLLDASRHLQDDEMYKCSLAIEPKSSGGKAIVHTSGATPEKSNGS